MALEERTKGLQQPTTFISHSSVDAVMAQELCRHLEALGVHCWIAPRDVRPGEPYAEEIVRGIEGCGSLILLATTSSVSSPNVMNELEQAFRLKRAVLTLMVKSPTIPRQLAYYIDRLHWLEASPDNLEPTAARLADVLRGEKDWPAVASPPSLSRRMHSSMPAFVGATAAIVLVLMVLGGVAWHFAHRARKQLAADYRSIGWVTLAANPTWPTEPPSANAQVWLGNASLPFSKTHLDIQIIQPGNTSISRDLKAEQGGEQTGEESFNVLLPTPATSLVTVLSVPAIDAGQKNCVKQTFAVHTLATGTSIAATGEPLVSEIPAGEPCQ